MKNILLTLICALSFAIGANAAEKSRKTASETKADITACGKAVGFISYESKGISPRRSYSVEILLKNGEHKHLAYQSDKEASVISAAIAKEWILCGTNAFGRNGEKVISTFWARDPDHLDEMTRQLYEDSK